MENKKGETLKIFKISEGDKNNFFEEIEISTGKEIVDLVKEKELTYYEAYASLEAAYNILKYESNFVKIPN